MGFYPGGGVAGEAIYESGKHNARKQYDRQGKVIAEENGLPQKQ